jgi:hypothetical protein
MEEYITEAPRSAAVPNETVVSITFYVPSKYHRVTFCSFLSFYEQLSLFSAVKL